MERDVRLECGEFRVKDNLRMAKLEDRIQLLYAKFSGKPLDTSSDWWSKLLTAAQLRNQLTHAKSIPLIAESTVTNAINAMLQTLDALYRAIYKKPFPAASQGLQSSLDF